MRVSADESTERDCAGSGRRSRLYRPTSSSAKCAASADEPPFPKVYTRPPFANVEIRRRAASSTSGSSSSTRASSARWSATASDADNGGIRSEPLVRDRRCADDTDRVAARGGGERDRLADHLLGDALAHRPHQPPTRA